MKYLSPELETFYKQFNTTKTLARKNVSCGIFQDCDYKENEPEVYQEKK